MILNTPIAVATRKYMQLNRERKHGNILVSNFIWGFVRAWQIDATVEGFLCLRKLERNWSTILFGFRSPFTILDICTTLCTFVTIFVLKLKKKNKVTQCYGIHIQHISTNELKNKKCFILKTVGKTMRTNRVPFKIHFVKKYFGTPNIFLIFYHICTPNLQNKTKPSYIKSCRSGYLYSRGTLHAKKPPTNFNSLYIWHKI